MGNDMGTICYDFDGTMKKICHVMDCKVDDIVCFGLDNEN